MGQAKRRSAEINELKNSSDKKQILVGPLDANDKVHQGKPLAKFYDGKTCILVGTSLILFDEQAFKSTVMFVQHFGDLNKQQIESIVQGKIKLNQNEKDNLPVFLVELNLQDLHNPTVNTVSTWRSAGKELLTTTTKNVLDYVGFGFLNDRILVVDI